MDVKQSPRARRVQDDTGLGVLPGLIGYQLRLAQRAIFADFADTVGTGGISPGLFGILVVIGENPGLTQQALANAAHLDRSTVVTVIDKLEDRGLVERRAADRRSNGLFLAAKGTALLQDLKRKVTRHERRVVQNLSAAERRQLVSLLQRILPERR
ncbi:MAG TPA: MarR family transcriptional regulator [Burkholderiales bacterium]|nr:MarR family transcriptional regulator [Burkholderiales bacterium]